MELGTFLHVCCPQGLSASQDPHRMASGELVVTDHLQVFPQVQVGGVLIGKGIQVGLWKDRAR